MDALSPLDGSADAVQAAAAAAAAASASAPAIDHRLALERELDRVNIAIHGAASAMGQHLNAILVSQSMLLLSYLVVLVGAWSTPIPGKRWLLAGIAGFGIAVVLLAYFGLRGARDRVGPLKQQRQRIEDALERVAARPPAFARQGPFTAVLSQLSTRALPLLMICGWVAMSFYTLALPIPTDQRTVTIPAADSRATAPVAKAVRPAAAKSNAVSSAAPTAAAAAETATPAATTADSDESPLLNFFRRIAREQPTQQQEVQDRP